MGIVSEPWGEGKGLVATHYRDTSGNRGWTEGQGRRSGSPEGRGDPRGQRNAAGGLPRCLGLGPAPSPSRDRDLARPEDGDDPQASRVAHRALADVHACQAEQEGGHGLRRELFVGLTFPSDVEGFSRTASTTQS